MKTSIICTIFLLFAGYAQAQRIGLEVQQYPTGFLSGIYGEFELKDQHTLNLRLGYNALDHQDFGVHDSEIGGGFGGSLGYRYYFKPAFKKTFIGVRSDLWFNSIDWEDISEAGNTKVTVLQPTVLAGYAWSVGERLRIVPELAFGREINVVTNGAEVGQGFILLWGLVVDYRL